MKKLLLVPLMAISLLVGCNDKQSQKSEKETVYTAIDWFENTDVIENELTFYVNGGGTEDYEKKVATKLLDCFKIDFKYPKVVKEVDTYDLMSYSIKKDMGPYTDFTMYIHEKCIETVAYAHLNNETIKQCARYETYHPWGAAYMISYAAKRDEEISKIRSEEYDAAKEVSTLENFFTQIEESTANPIATFSNVTKEDVGHALLDDFKDLFTPYSEKSHSGYGDAFMSYGLNEDFMLRFYLDSQSNDCIAVLKYNFQGSLGYEGSVTNGYRVSREKIDNLIKKITVATN